MSVYSGEAVTEMEHGQAVLHRYRECAVPRPRAAIEANRGLGTRMTFATLARFERLDTSGAEEQNGAPDAMV